MVKSLYYNHFLPPLNLSTNISFTIYPYCYFSGPAYYIVTMFSITNTILFLPLFTFILCHGLQKWWQMFFTSSPATMSHSDCFTYHLVIFELIGVVGSILCLYAINKKDLNYFKAAIVHSNFTWYGQIFFHILTCAERYLAAVHPITYMRLRNARGIRIRNVAIGCAWLLSCVSIGLRFIEDIYIIQECSILISALMVISFFSLSVLRVLIHSGPGENGRDRVDRRKQRAFFTTVAILGVLALRFAWGLPRVLLNESQDYSCLMVAFELLLILPCSLVLPFLFLHRGAKLKCFERVGSPG